MNLRSVSPAEAKELIDNEGYTYLDVRSVPEFEAGHPAGASNVPLLDRDPVRGMVPNADFVSVVRQNFPTGAKLVVGCQANGRSMRACEILAHEGYVDLVLQNAGFGGARDPFGRVVMAGWQEAGLPVEQGSGTGKSYADLKGGEG